MTRLTTSGMCKLTAIGVEKVGEKEEKPGEVPWLRGILGSPSRTRTYNLVVNSHPLCRLSYRGIAPDRLILLPRSAGLVKVIDVAFRSGSLNDGLSPLFRTRLFREKDFGQLRLVGCKRSQ